jgi:N-acylglucosamine-6-phosphate 2-epimerase
MREVEDIIRAGADIVAIDATMRPRPFGEGEAELAKLVEFVHLAGKLAMADISNLDEALRAENFGFDLVSTTLSGYTSNSPAMPGPDIDLVKTAATGCQVPVIAEGRYWSPADAHQALEVGAHAVVVGTAITNPWKTTEYFINGMKIGMGTV